VWRRIKKRGKLPKPFKWTRELFIEQPSDTWWKAHDKYHDEIHDQAISEHLGKWVAVDSEGKFFVEGTKEAIIKKHGVNEDDYFFTRIGSYLLSPDFKENNKASHISELSEIIPIINEKMLFEPEQDEEAMQRMAEKRKRFEEQIQHLTELNNNPFPDRSAPLPYKLLDKPMRAYNRVYLENGYSGDWINAYDIYRDKIFPRVIETEKGKWLAVTTREDVFFLDDTREGVSRKVVENGFRVLDCHVVQVGEDLKLWNTF